MSKYKVVDLFSGVGGLSYGFYHHKDFEIVAANELLSAMAKAYSLNHPGVKMYQGDIAELHIDQLLKDVEIKTGDVDVLIGGPPCQAYSTVGKRVLDDPRGALFQEYYRLLKELSPKFFIYENVKGLLSIRGGLLFESILELFASLGYEVRHQVLNAADYGVPQVRERVVITGTRLPCEFTYPLPTHNTHLTLGEAIGDLPFISSGETSTEYGSAPQNAFQETMRKAAPSQLMDQDAALHNPQLISLMEHLPDGGCPDDIPEKLRPTSGFKNTYCRLWWERPAPTITRNLGTPSSSRCIHPKVARALTTREGARLQSFPDSFYFYGSRSERNLQVGNAVPPLLSSALAGAVSDYFKAI